MHRCRRAEAGAASLWAGGSPVHTLPGCGEPAGGVPEAGVENEIGDAAKDGTQEPAQGKGVLGLR